MFYFTNGLGSQMEKTMKATMTTAEVVNQWFVNHYTCPRCGAQWEDEWSSTVDDECPECQTRNISPHHSEEVAP
ncbi:hypothetical protein [Thiolapillus sp.]|uniref:hypothetical protein n=1 Tax=Thiolapillus sp. TaxID=2017437 RepID=UPI0025DE26FD|nr:hypothetical protein [Thiolapillus sp.]